MKKLTTFMAAAALLGSGTAALADDTKIGILMDITGPIANFIPPLQNAADLAVKQVNEQGGLLGGSAVAVYGDTTGTAQGAVDAAQKLVNVENVPIIMGSLMSGTTIAAAEAAIIPAGVPQISPTATSPAMTFLEDNGLVFRIVPSDNYQGEILAKMVMDEGIKKVALTYVNNDYGVGIGETFIDAYTEAGGEIVAEAKHEEKKDSYRSELASLAKGDAEALVVIAYAGDSGGKIVRQAIEGGLFTKFVGTDGLRDELLIQNVGADALKTSFFSSPTSPAENPAQKALHDAFNAAYGEGADKAFVDQTYDATFLALLAIEKAGSTDRAKIAEALKEVAMAPGEKVGPGEWAKAIALIKEGKDIDYEGASGSAEFDENGDVGGYIGKFVVDGDGYKQVEIVE
ncbi:branched-chain amino acid transport system substrate-binding protein [Labrenzia sp. MBR-25]|uniref:Hydrophobic amino acid ABC transporter (HAAT) family, amino acid-binding protein n=1 Tax=Roseibium aggregatum (strain ATCC 25650 / DSM 13394 / JCM 20685 / NBRC 16684 / NCIMB 2208 / IAM 12614 / B1) TaxID=384765 RepID=A0NLZ5_ROSAI|nr:ABC transporter substrate-binding protein [Roseibium aggregatum]EAV46090.1 hydrophobic amino acid ABC transporter (HAAT) family, amino acid-binding protein [Stappia aggregata IAM 12614] [Roseibium aggregatum IAM 12614]